MWRTNDEWITCASIVQQDDDKWQPCEPRSTEHDERPIWWQNVTNSRPHQLSFKWAIRLNGENVEG